MTVLSGGCLCGAVRYVFTGTVGPATYCHCSDCRRASGSAFGVSVRLSAGGFRVVSGMPTGFLKRGDSGGELTRHFCAACGSPLFTTSSAHPDTVFVKAGSLDDPGRVAPAHQSWTGSRVSWSDIPRDLPASPSNRR